MLELDNVHAYYGDSHVLHGVSMAVDKGEVVCCSDATAPARRRRC